MNNSVEQNPFHLAIPVHNLIIAREFYLKTLGFVEGRSDEKWIDFNFYGHQLVIHDIGKKTTSNNNNFVDGHGVPVPHFGVVLTMNKWQLLKERLKSKKINFIIEPYVRFQNLPRKCFFKNL